VATVVSVVSAPVVRLIFGPAYEGGGAVLSLLVWWLTLFFLNISSEIILYAATRQDDALKLSLGALGLTLVFNLWLIPRYGATGAAATMLAAELICLPVRFALARRYVPVAFWRSLARPCLCAAALGAWLWCFRGGNLLVHAPVALALYVAGLFVTRAVVVSELRELWRMVRPG
jgi:O-antigen/teichoic acid export membrane protein